MADEIPKLGDLASSERLIADLYIDLRKRINMWAAISHQTAQARMGYVGQHLVSVVTGFPGGKSGARGRDLVLPDNQYAEIKTCYRVDQLGRCNSCDVNVASIERVCPECGSEDIKRNDDSKWLIGIRHDEEFAHILEPASYYLVLFDFVDLNVPDTIRSSIWEINPKHPGFALCMVDYRLNIQTSAPFNLWPYQLKFSLMRPKLIYQSNISTIDDSIRTDIFPGRDEPQLYKLRPLEEYSRSQNLSYNKIVFLTELLGAPGDLPSNNKREALRYVQNYIDDEALMPELVADKLSFALYVRGIEESIDRLPEPLGTRISDLVSAI